MMKRYLGDGVYAEYDGYAIVLTTENGYEVTNTIVLELSVLEGLNQYMQMLNDIKRQALGSVENHIAPGQD